jgi:hypothetical protein
MCCSSIAHRRRCSTAAAQHYQVLQRLKDAGVIRARHLGDVDTADEIQTVADTTGCDAIELRFDALHQEPATAFQQAGEAGIGSSSRCHWDPDGCPGTTARLRPSTGPAAAGPQPTGTGAVHQQQSGCGSLKVDHAVPGDPVGPLLSRSRPARSAVP